MDRVFSFTKKNHILPKVIPGRNRCQKPLNNIFGSFSLAVKRDQHKIVITAINFWDYRQR